MKILRLLLLLALTFLTASLFLIENNDTTSKKNNSDKKFYFAAWGDIKKGTIEEQKAYIKKLTDAGLTDLYPMLVLTD